MAVRAFSLFGEVALKGDRDVESRLKRVSNQANKTTKDLGHLKGSMSFGGGALSGLNSALGTLSNISNTIQGIPVIGRLIEGAVSTISGPVKDIAQLGLEFNDLKENATLAFSVILKDGEKAKRLFADLQKFGVQSPIFKTGDLIRYTQQLLPILGGGPELFDALKGIGAATAATGRMERMGDIFLAFTQIARKPKLSSEEMSQQLSEAGVDAWGLLARGLGRTPGEVMEMSAGGQLSGIGSFKVMVAQALREYGSLVDLMGQTRTGKQAQIDDMLEQLAARSTLGLHGTWKGGQDRLIEMMQGPKGGQLADQISATTGEIGGRLLGGFDALMDGSLLTQAQAAAKNVVGSIQGTIQGAGESARQTMAGYADALYQGFTSFWEIKSPSERARRLGQWIKEGLELGLSQGQAQNYARMKWASEQDPEFIKSIVAGSARRGINPDDMLNLIAIESGFNKAVINPWGYGGLGQVGRSERRSLGLPGGDAEFKKLLQSHDYAWQVENVLFPFLDMKMAANPGVKSGGISLAELYAMWGSGHATGNPNAVHMSKGGKRALAFSRNPLWNVNQDSKIQEWEFGPAAMSALGAGDKFSITDAIPAGAKISVDQAVAVANFLRVFGEAMAKTGAGQKLTTEQAVAIANSLQSFGIGAVAGNSWKGFNPGFPDTVKGGQTMAAFATSDMIRNLGEQLEKTNPEVKKLGETTALTAEQIEANRKLAEMPEAESKKKKAKDRIFDPAFTREGVAGDFQSGLQYMFANLGWEKPTSLAKQFGIGLLRDIQTRIGHDISASITGALFGTRGEDGKLQGGINFGGIFSKLFGGLFGGGRASGGSMSAGRFYMAGEYGPELISGPGHVYNARETKQMMGGGYDPHYTIVAIGDREVGSAVDAYRLTPRGRRARLIQARYMRKIIAYT